MNILGHNKAVKTYRELKNNHLHGARRFSIYGIINPLQSIPERN